MCTRPEEAESSSRTVIPHEVMLARLEQSEQMREFFIQMWMKNPALAKQGGARVQALLTPLESVDAEENGSAPSAKPLSSRGKGWEEGKQHGASLIELIMFIVIVAVALAGILLVMNTVTRSSADPLIHKQALAIAESLLEEVELMPFTYCDPDDPAAGLATTVDITACTAPAGGEAIGPEGETRYLVPQYDNVNDYNLFIMNAGNGGIKDISFPINPAIAALSGYSASVAVAAQAFSGIAALDVNGAPQALLITVTVTGPDLVPVVIEGIRTRYAPRAVP